MGKGRTFQGILSRLTDFPFSSTVLTTGSWKAFASKRCGKKADPPATAADLMNFLREKAFMVESFPDKSGLSRILYTIFARQTRARKKILCKQSVPNTEVSKL
jgi:hypothetical protein